MAYAEWKKSVLGKSLNVDGNNGPQCVDVVKSWSNYILGVDFSRTGLHGNAKDLWGNASPVYYEKILNDHNNPGQLPKQGDIIVFAASPEKGYTSTFYNPYGHTGVVDIAIADHLVLVQQDGSTAQSTTEPKTRAWRYTRCIGWLRPKPTAIVGAPVIPKLSSQALSKTVIGKRVYLSPHVSDWRVYKPGTKTVAGHLDPMHVVSARSYIIRGIDTLPGRVLINSGQFGHVSLPVDGDAQIR